MNVLMTKRAWWPGRHRGCMGTGTAPIWKRSPWPLQINRQTVPWQWLAAFPFSFTSDASPRETLLDWRTPEAPLIKTSQPRWRCCGARQSIRDRAGAEGTRTLSPHDSANQASKLVGDASTCELTKKSWGNLAEGALEAKPPLPPEGATHCTVGSLQ